MDTKSKNKIDLICQGAKDKEGNSTHFPDDVITIGSEAVVDN